MPKRTPAPDMKSLSQRLALSPSTVSRVLSGQGDRFRISAKTQKRVLDAAKASGVVVNHVARGLRLRNTQTLGLVIPDISNPFFAHLARHVERLGRERGYTVLLADSQESVEVEDESLRLMIGRRVDGLILAPVHTAPGVIDLLKNANLPCVLVDRIFNDAAFSSVAAANHDGAEQAVQHLIAAGHRRIACLQGCPGNHANEQRVQGYHAAMAAAGLAVQPHWIVGDRYDLQAGHEAVTALLRIPPAQRPTALLALGNLIALGALKELRHAGIKLPGQMSVISFDEQPWSELIDPPLTTVSQPIDEIGAHAMELLFASIQGANSAAQHRIVAVNLVERGSVAAFNPS